MCHPKTRVRREAVSSGGGPKGLITSYEISLKSLILSKKIHVNVALMTAMLQLCLFLNKKRLPTKEKKKRKEINKRRKKKELEEVE